MNVFYFDVKWIFYDEYSFRITKFYFIYFMFLKNVYFVKLGKVYNNNLLLKRIRKYSKREKELEEKMNYYKKINEEKLEILSKKLDHLVETEFLLKEKIAVEKIYIGSLENILKNLKEKGSFNLPENIKKFERNIDEDYINKIKIRFEEISDDYYCILLKNLPENINKFETNIDLDQDYINKVKIRFEEISDDYENILNQDYINKLKIKLKEIEKDDEKNLNNYNKTLNNYNKILEEISDLIYSYFYWLDKELKKEKNEEEK